MEEELRQNVDAFISDSKSFLITEAMKIYLNTNNDSIKLLALVLMKNSLYC